MAYKKSTSRGSHLHSAVLKDGATHNPAEYFFDSTLWVYSKKYETKLLILYYKQYIHEI